MSNLFPSPFIVAICIICALLGSWIYFRRFTVTRPPIGVFNLRDIFFLIGSILVMSFLYLVFPLWLTAMIFVLFALNILYFTCEPLLRTAKATWPIILGLIALDSGIALWLGTKQNGFFVVNNIILILLCIGVSNLWAQSGMRARDVTVLGLILIIYDYLATSQLPVMTTMMTRLAVLPLSPMVIWGSGTHMVGIGLGDLLLASVFPLVIRKAFGYRAGMIALGIALVALGGMLLWVRGIFPVMVVLGPLMVLQYLFWRSRYGRERTMGQYLQQEPKGRPQGA